MKSKSRIQKTAEVFTPAPLVNEILDKLNETDPTIFTNPNKTFIDNSCGNGQFLIEVVATKYEYLLSQGVKNKKQILSTTFGVDLMVDNVCDSIARIVFFLECGEDIFDKKGQPVKELTVGLTLKGKQTELGEYEEKDSADFNWLEKNHNWVRTYTYKEHTIKVRPNKDRRWMMEYSIEDRTHSVLTNGSKFNLYHWIICADALKYHYRFDDTHPHDDDANGLLTF